MKSFEEILKKELGEFSYKTLCAISTHEFRQQLSNAAESYANQFAPNLPSDGWVSVEERLPEEDEYVLVSNKDAVYIATGTYIRDENRWYMYGDYYSSSIEVTHWQPLPIAPKSVRDKIKEGNK